MKYILSALAIFLISTNSFSQSKKELKQLKKQLRTERKIEKEKKLIDKKIIYLQSPFWIKVEKNNPSLGIVEFDPRKGYPFYSSVVSTVLQMIRIVAY